MKDKVHHYDILEEMIRSRDKEHLIQATEIERRMTGLNGEAGRIQEILKTTIPREVFDRTVSNMNEKNEARVAEVDGRFGRIVEQVKNDIKYLSDYKTKQEGKGQWQQFIPWLIAAAVAVHDIFKK